MLLILALIIGASGSQPVELDETFRRTYTNDELLEFCNNRHSREAGVRTRGYLHPSYCSRYIECNNVKTANGRDRIKAREKVCEKCLDKGHESREDAFNRKQNIQLPIPCKFGRLQWDEDTQSCQPQSRKCIQAELPSNNVWGRRDMAHVCQDVPVGTTQTFRHPTHCGKYVTCFRDRDYFEDLWVGVESCPPCRPNDTNCPQGYMQYHRIQNDTNAGLCHLASDIPKYAACILTTTQTPNQEGSIPRPLPLTTTEAPRHISENFSKQKTSQRAAKFCKSKEKNSRRYLVPDKCNSYYYCFADLFDKDGEERPLEKVHHFKFLCDTCSDVLADSANCNATTNGQVNYLQFDFEQQTCIIPRNGTCTENGTFVPKENELTEQKTSALTTWRKGILSQEEVTSFCKKQKGDGNFLHPNDTACSHYIECWSKMGVFKEKSCPECHPSIKDSGTLCPTGHLYFNASSGVCQIGRDKSCGSEGGNVSDKGPSFVWSTTPNPTQSLEKMSNEAAHPELLTPKECHLKHYVQRGYCKKFFTCDRKKRVEKQHECSGRLFWNPDANSIHGGVCDYLKNIDNFTLWQYKKDPACPLHIAYFRRDDAECSGTYYYHHPSRTQGKEIKLKCPEDLLWSKEAKTCTKCHEILKKDGSTPCCSETNVEDLDYP